MEDEPVLQRHLHWIWQAFTDLNYRRASSLGGALPINYTDIHSYCLLKGIYSIMERERLCKLLDVLDRHWMTKHYEKQKNGGETPKPPPTPSPRTSGRKSSRTKVS